jgi:inorganic pyrophosphatase
MAKRVKNGKGLQNPNVLQPLDETNSSVIQVIIETPKGSRNKYAFDTDQGIFELKKVLPCDIGFVPSTVPEDGEPVDVLVLMDEPAFPGCLLRCRLIGRGDSREKTSPKTGRNCT